MPKKARSRLIKGVIEQMQKDIKYWSRVYFPKICGMLLLMLFIGSATTGVISLVLWLSDSVLLGFVCGLIVACLQVGIIMWLWISVERVNRKINKENKKTIDALTDKREGQ